MMGGLQMGYTSQVLGDSGNGNGTVGVWPMVSWAGVATYVGEGCPHTGGVLELFVLVVHANVETGHVMFKGHT